MIKDLIKIKKILPQLIVEKALNNEINTLYIDYHKPFVSRIWFKYEDFRVFLHKIEPCSDSIEALYHPHKWDSAMEILQGSYEMGIGHSDTNEIPKTDCKLILNKGAKYEMTEPNGWHYVNPLYKKPVFTIMISGKLNGREMPIEPNKEFRSLKSDEVLEILNIIKFDKYIDKMLLINHICK